MGAEASFFIDALRKDDLDRVMEIETASFTMPWSRNLFLSEFRNSAVSLLLAARAAGSSGAVIGYIVCWITADELHILDLATSEDRRRQGIARELARTALARGYGRGARRAFLEVRDSNAAAKKLYGGLGFIESMRRRAYYELPVEDAVVMSLDEAGYRALLGVPAHGPGQGN